MNKFTQLIQDNKAQIKLSTLIVNNIPHSGEQVLTRAKEIAIDLSKLALNNNQSVIFICPNSLDWLAFLVAFTHLEIPIVPIESELDTDEYTKKIHDANAAIIICHQSVNLQEATENNNFDYEGNINSDEFAVYRNPGSTASMPNQCMMMRSSSGTSGTEKYIILSYMSLYTTINQYKKLLKQLGYESVFIFKNISDIMMLKITLAFILSGKKVVFFTGEKEQILNQIQKHDVQVFPVVPIVLETIHQNIINRVGQGLIKRCFNVATRFFGLFRRYTGINLGRILLKSIHRPFGRSLKVMLTGGSHTRTQVLRDLYNMGFQINEGYGITECSGIICYHTGEYHELGTVGKPTEVVKVDIDDSGEIKISGEQLCLGYFNKDENRSAFRDGWYYTGDTGHWDKNGNLIIDGRLKDELVLSDSRCYMPEYIEDMYYGIPGIIEHAVVSQYAQSSSGAKLILAVVKATAFTKEQILSAIESRKKHIPSLFHINDFVFVDHLPRTGLGKIKRKALLKQYKNRLIT